MKLVIVYAWYDKDIEKSNHHRIKGWKRLGFNKVIRDGYDFYRVKREKEFNWNNTNEITKWATDYLHDLYNGIVFTNDFDFEIVSNFTEAFLDAEKYIKTIKSAYVVDGLWGKPDLNFVKYISSNNGDSMVSVDTRDTITIRIEGLVDPIQVGKKKPILKGNYYTCPVCGNNVFKNYLGCTNCKQFIDWEDVVLGKM
jgi:hypothetical protein